MKFLPAINLWADGIIEALRSGQLKLNPGQWVRCGEKSKCSRFIGVTSGGTIWLEHPSSGEKVDFLSFRSKLDSFKRTKRIVVKSKR